MVVEFVKYLDETEWFSIQASRESRGIDELGVN